MMGMPDNLGPKKRLTHPQLTKKYYTGIEMGPGHTCPPQPLSIIRVIRPKTTCQPNETIAPWYRLNPQ